MSAKQHIILAKYPKGYTAFIFYDVKSRRYSGHFFMERTLEKDKAIRTILETFPPTFDDVGEFRVQLLKEKNIDIDFQYLPPEEGQLREYDFFEKLKGLCERKK